MYIIKRLTASSPSSALTPHERKEGHKRKGHSNRVHPQHLPIVKERHIHYPDPGPDPLPPHHLIVHIHPHPLPLSLSHSRPRLHSHPPPNPIHLSIYPSFLPRRSSSPPITTHTLPLRLPSPKLPGHLLAIEPPPLIRPLQRQQFRDTSRVERGAFGDEDVVGFGDGDRGRGGEEEEREGEEG